MRRKIYKEKECVGSVSSPDGVQVLFGSDCDPAFRKAAEAMMRDGVRRKRCMFDAKKMTHTIVEESVGSDDPHFALAFFEYLECAGYGIEGVHHDLDMNLKRMLGALPQSPERDEVLQDFSLLTHLEKTALLESLRKKQESVQQASSGQSPSQK